MIPIHRNPSSHFSGDVRIKIVGLGGAGSNALDRIVLDGSAGVELLAINTDVQALTASVAQEKVQLGRTTTRGLGAGGDPEVGYAAGEESVEELRAALEGAKIVLLCVGLGGGTGSGAGRIVAAVARELKAYVVAVTTLPFAFEGKRRMAQAEEALSALQRNADLVICFENDRMGDTVSPLAGIQEAFAAADQTISQSVRALAGMAQQRGLVHIGFDELATVIRGAGDAAPRCLFGYGEAEGDNRAHEALARALRCPLMDKGRMLEDARNILVNVAGGAGMTLNEVQILMEEFNRHISDQTRLHFGATVDARLGQKISVTILSAIDGSAHAASIAAPARLAARTESSPVSAAAPAASAPQATEPPPHHAPEPRREREPEIEPEPEPEILYAQARQSKSEPEPEPEPESEPAPEPERREPVVTYVDADEPASLPEPEYPRPATPSPALVQAAATAAAAAAATASARPAGKSKALARQEQMQFEPVTRGRFEKSEPTIVDGQDLDVPTFLRRNVKLR